MTQSTPPGRITRAADAEAPPTPQARDSRPRGWPETPARGRRGRAGPGYRGASASRERAGGQRHVSSRLPGGSPVPRRARAEARPAWRGHSASASSSVPRMNSSAVRSREGSRRMSSGPSLPNESPRAGSSSWSGREAQVGDDAVQGRHSEFVEDRLDRRETPSDRCKTRWRRRRIRANTLHRRRIAVHCDHPMPPPPNAATISRLCPPRPRVASKYVPCGSVISSRTASCLRTGM